MISNILHTDMKKHFDLIKDFQIKMKEIKENISEQNMSINYEIIIFNKL